MKEESLMIVQANVQKNANTLHAILNDEELRDHAAVLVQEPNCFRNDEGETVVPPLSSRSWKQFKPTMSRTEGRFPVRAAIYVRQGLKAQQIAFPSPDVVAVELTTGDRVVFLASVYIPPSNNPMEEAREEAERVLQPLAAEVRKRPIMERIIAGDFNRHDQFWGGENTDRNRGEPILQFMAELDLTSLLPRGTATHRSGTTIDLALASPLLEENLIRCELWPTQYGSDHRMINTTFDWKAERIEDKPRMQYRHTNWSRVNKILTKSIEEHPLPTIERDRPEEIENLADELTSRIKEMVDSQTPRTAPSGYAKRWWTLDLTDLRRNYTEARNRATAVRRASQRDQTLEDEAAEAKKLFHDTIRRHRRTHWDNFLDDVDNVWKATKYLHPAERGSVGNIAKLTVGDRETSTEPEMAEVLLEQFFSQRAEAEIPEETTLPTPVPWPALTRTELQDAVRRMKPHKAPGPDGLPTVAWQKTWPVVEDYVYNLFAASLRTAYIPTQWRTARIIPLRKEGKGDYTQPAAYRPISLLSTLGKILEAVVAERLSYLDDKHGLLPKAHHGARKQRSTTDALLVLAEKVHRAWKEKRILSVVTYDVKGAYNGVNKDSLARALRGRQIPPPVVAWVHAFCSNRRASVVVNSQESEVRTIEHPGLPQGSPLSPILFLFFNADLVAGRQTGRQGSMAFVDDFTAWVIGLSILENTDRIQTEILPKVEAWAKASGATFEPTKTQFIHFTRCPRIKMEVPPALRFMGSTLGPSRSIKLLGVIMDQDLRYKEHLTKATWRGEKAAVALNRLKGLRPNAARRVFKAAVAPKMDYAAPIWAPQITKTFMGRLTRASKIGARAVTGIFASAAAEVALAEAALEDPNIRLEEAMRRFWITAHARPQRHPTHRLLGRLKRTKRHVSPLQRMEEKFSHIDCEGMEKIPAFTKPPWMEAPEVNLELPTREDVQPRERELLFYADGSCRNGRTGAGWFSPNLNRRWRTTIAWAPNTDAFYAEQWAIKSGLESIAKVAGDLRPNYNTIRFLCDCKRILGRIKSPGGTKDTNLKEIYDSLRGLRKQGISVRFQWVPAHKGFEGNEAAHEEAVAATEEGTTPLHSQVKTRQQTIQTSGIAAERIEELYRSYQTGQKIKNLDKSQPGKHTKNIYDRCKKQEARILVQLRSGYSRLNDYLWCIGAAPGPECECGQRETREHFLLQCPRWTKERRKMREEIQTRNEDLPYLLGAYTSEAQDGEKTKWKPDWNAVKQVIRFAISTGRLNFDAR